MASELMEKLSNLFTTVKAEEEDEPEEEEEEEEVTVKKKDSCDFMDQFLGGSDRSGHSYKGSLC